MDGTRLAVVSGDFDSIEVAIDRLGFKHDVYCGDSSINYGGRTLLSDPMLMSQYDIIFLNCGHEIDFSSERIKANLYDFVRSGGSVYASDLSSGILSATFPSIFSFQQSVVFDSASTDACCTCVDICPSLCEADLSNEVESYYSICIGTNQVLDACFGPSVQGYGEEGDREAVIENENLRSAVGQDMITLRFYDPGWVGLSESNPQVETLVGGDQPYMVRYTSEAGGRVIFTSFHNHDQPSESLERILRAVIFEL